MTTPEKTSANRVVRLIEDEREWDTLQPQWDALFQVSPTASPPLRWEWLREWWRVYGPVYGDEGRNLRIWTVWRGSELVGALPLYLQTASGSFLKGKSLRFLSSGEEEFEETCANYLDLLHAPGEETGCVQSLRAGIMASNEWDLLELDSVRRQSPLVGEDFRFPTGHQWDVTSAGICPVAEVNEDFEAYLAQLSQKNRKEARRTLRAVEENGIRLEIAATAEDVERYFDQLVDLHQHRSAVKGQAGCYSAPRFTEFHRSLCRKLAPEGAIVLARLMMGDQPLILLHTLVVRDELHFYSSGRLMDQEGPLHSPGVAARLLLIEHLSGRGVKRFDFLCDDPAHPSYKKRLATQERELVNLRVIRPTVRGMGESALGALRRAAGLGRRLASVSGARSTEPSLRREA